MNLAALFHLKPRKWWLESLIAFPAVCAFAYMAYLRYTYTWEMPLSPVVESGRTIAMTVNFNRLVYVTAAEHAKLITAYIATGIGFGVVAICAIVRANKPSSLLPPRP